MKILPPLTHMLWPPGQCPLHNIRNRVLPVAAVLLAVSAIAIVPDGSVTRTATVSGGQPLAACSTLISWPSTEDVFATPCHPIALSEGSSIRDKSALARQDLPAAHELTDADRAIVRPPRVLRPSLWDTTNRDQTRITDLAPARNLGR